MSRLPNRTTSATPSDRPRPGLRSTFSSRASVRSFAVTDRNRAPVPSRSNTSRNSISRGCPPIVRATSRRSSADSSRSAGSRRNSRRSSAGLNPGRSTRSSVSSLPGTG